jgi:Zn-finger nucleic acid-binding protein
MALKTSLACPDCKVALAAVTSGSIVAHRCARCRGIWLDPRSFQRLCEDEARPPDDETAIARSGGATPPRTGPRDEDRVRYRACPACGDVMNRSNFGRVSGVVIDVCRPHGAWFDRGELAAIRRFLRSGGVGRYERHRRMERERRSTPSTARPAPAGASPNDIYDVLVGGNASWDVPSRIPRLLVAAFFGAAGAWLLWRAFHHYGRGLGANAAVLGLVSVYLAWRALREWAERRGRSP